MELEVNLRTSCRTTGREVSRISEHCWVRSGSAGERDEVDREAGLEGIEVLGIILGAYEAARTGTVAAVPTLSPTR